ncbi:MAG: hypothetical protein HY059_05940 [Proteobacteria bacterium]|nr:hypothetical protein [Pseudomonadota bacterium]
MNRILSATVTTISLAGTILTAHSASAQGGDRGVAATVAADSMIRFPSVVGSNLEGKRFALPGDFEAEYDVVIVAFRREQQADVDSWMPFLREQKLAERGVRVYEVPTLNRSYRWMRGFIDGGMARGIPAKATREATITLYIDKAPFKRALGITTEERIVAMLVTRDGRVLWRADGRFAPAAGAQLMSTLDALNERTAP